VKSIYRVPLFWLPRGGGLRERVQVRGEVVLVVLGPDGAVKSVHRSRNLITNDGDQWMAQRIAGEATTENFQAGIMELGTAGDTPAKTSTRANLTAKLTPTKSVTFLTNETDADNGGAGAVDKVTWKAQWAAGEATHAAITHVIVTNASPAAGEKILTLATGFSVNKGAPDTLKAFINHELLGV